MGRRPRVRSGCQDPKTLLNKGGGANKKVRRRETQRVRMIAEMASEPLKWWTGVEQACSHLRRREKTCDRQMRRAEGASARGAREIWFLARNLEHQTACRINKHFTKKSEFFRLINFQKNSTSSKRSFHTKLCIFSSIRLILEKVWLFKVVAVFFSAFPPSWVLLFLLPVFCAS